MMISDKRTKGLIIILSVALGMAVILCAILAICLHNAYKSMSVCEWNMTTVSEEELSFDSDYNPEFMTLAIQNALDGMEEHKGGPIGAAGRSFFRV